MRRPKLDQIFSDDGKCTMKAFIVLVLFVGLFLVTHGVYEQKLRQVSQKTKIEYRFIPRSYYDEQLAEAHTSAHFKDMFQKESPWFDKTVGPLLNLDDESVNNVSS